MVPARTLSRRLHGGGQIAAEALLQRGRCVGHATSLAVRARSVACRPMPTIQPVPSLTPATSVGGVARDRRRLPRVRALYEVNAYRLRRVDVPMLPPRCPDDPGPAGLRPPPDPARRGAAALGLPGSPALEPDLVIDTGDNLSHPDAVPFVVRSLGRLLDVPGRVRLGLQRLLRADLQESRWAISSARRTVGSRRTRRCPGETRPRLRARRLDRPDPRPDHAGDQGRHGSASAAPTTRISASTATPRSPARSTATRSTSRSGSPTRRTGG